MVAFASGAVLTLEIVSLRLVAPYVGLTLETNTAVIGFALAAIASGAALGGRIADRFPPSSLIGPAFLCGGILVLLVGPAVRWTGNQTSPGDVVTVLLITAVAVFIPASLLSAITPMVVKLRLGALSETGTIVGSLSGVATLGALVATFGTGFVLVAAVPTTVILLVLGAALILVGVVLVVRRGLGNPVPAVVAIVAAAGVVIVAPEAPCDVETAYHCARVVADEGREDGRTLQLDTLSHSYVDLEDPTYLGFRYVRGIASIVDEMVPQDGLRALHLGGGGMTLPRYLAATRSGTDNLVFEIDPGVVELDQTELGVRVDEELRVRVQDARVGVSAESTGSRDLVVGDAFSGLSVPWHLTTRETVAEVRRVLDAGGIYVVNVIDYPPLGFARAEVATIADVFPSVAVVSRPAVLGGRDGGNLLIIGSERAITEEELTAAVEERVPELDVIGMGDIASFIGDAQVLTDDFAPVDQLLTPYGGR